MLPPQAELWSAYAWLAVLPLGAAGSQLTPEPSSRPGWKHKPFWLIGEKEGAVGFMFLVLLVENGELWLPCRVALK